MASLRQIRDAHQRSILLSSGAAGSDHAQAALAAFRDQQSLVRKRVDRIEQVSQAEAEEMTRRLAREEGIFAGISSGGAMHVALRVSKELRNAVIVSIVCDRGDRYLTTGVFPD